MAVHDAPPRAAPAPAAPTEPSTAGLLRGLVDDIATLMRQSILLARQEMTEEAVRGAKAGALLAAAGVLALFAFGFGLAAAAVAIPGPSWLGPLIVFGALALVAAVLGLVGRWRLARTKIGPRQTQAELRGVAADLREEIKWARPQPQPREKSS